ncbi:preprotein translocase subunit YajC [Pediococcus acidilactici]|jgi:preprotein translocase subunit YajC|uniref:preprotein translocase subunit YajC n=1 Tax=Pediococcus acidilactici TaxID=1254 RepID=UPI000FF48DE1|nr:preprotein translocase subunit YajC [Pediococcus acidilactici]RWY85880.1 preprotein translocase subunit YajC [Pediococcus acidilactici]
MNYLIVAALLVVLVVYLVLIPLAKRKNMKSAQTKLENFYNSLRIGDLVVLSDGIKGKIMALDGEFYQVQIANNVVVEINKFGIVNKVGERK